MKKVVLAEKPSVAKEIARILKCNVKNGGYYKNETYVVTWALGHLVTLADPEVYTDKWKVWSLEELPMIPPKFKTVVIKEVSKQFKIVKELLTSTDVKEVIIATDAGREGELVARWIIEKAGYRGKLSRLWVSSLTDAALNEGFQNLKPATAYDNLYKSAEARAIADWLIGINATRALTCKYNEQLSAGRVQTPTLAMVVERENEIRSFLPKPFYQIIINYRGTDFTYINSKNEKRIFDYNEALSIVNEIKNYTGLGVITNITSTPKTKTPPLLYDLTELQRDGNKYYGFSPKQTLDIIQRLYEHYKYLTYPRTDSRYLTLDMYDGISKRIKNLVNTPYKNIVNKILMAPIQKSKRVFDNKKVTDHHAIIPTELVPNLMMLASNEVKIMELVIKRFLAAFMENYTYDAVKVTLTIRNHKFVSEGINIKNKGWKEIYGSENFDDEDSMRRLPDFKEKETVKVNNIKMMEGKTTPPDRYTEASILTAMEHPGKWISDRVMKEVIEQSSGIGTPATRADILEKLFTVGYMELKGKSIYPTGKGMQLINLVPKELRSPLLTAEWESRLIKIEKGIELSQVFIDDMKKASTNIIDEIINKDIKYRYDNMTSHKCPECGKALLEVKSKNGTYLKCSNQACKYRRNVSRLSNARCPNCHKKMNIIGNDENKFYLCSCGFKEKCLSFNKKIEEHKKELNRYELNAYLHNQQKEIPKNNPFMEMFNNLNNKK